MKTLTVLIALILSNVTLANFVNIPASMIIHSLFSQKDYSFMKLIPFPKDGNLSKEELYNLHEEYQLSPLPLGSEKADIGIDYIYVVKAYSRNKATLLENMLTGTGSDHFFATLLGKPLIFVVIYCEQPSICKIKQLDIATNDETFLKK